MTKGFVTGLLGAIGVLGAASAPAALVILNSIHVRSGEAPDGWTLKSNRGAPDVSAIDDAGGKVIRLKSNKSSFALERSVDVDLARFPYLSWNWKVSQLPKGGDFRRSATDDQAAQVLVAFSDRRVLTYLWDTSAPKGIMESASAIPLVHIWAFVCRSGASELNRWIPESRNIVEDFKKAYNRPPPRVKGIRLQINSQHTGTSAESYFGEVSFRSAADRAAAQ
ncbi:MAG: DUF3047 domain-containing protein [Bryobacteraceae bacterium]